MKPLIRPVQSGEERALWEVFQSSVHERTQAAYSAEQRLAWAPLTYPEDQWVARIRANRPFVAVLEDRIAGFADLQPDGYIDHFFVAAFAAGAGIGSALMAHLQAEAARLGLPSMYANVSVTAQPFFARFGFAIEAEQEVTRNGVLLRNARMRRPTA